MELGQGVWATREASRNGKAAAACLHRHSPPNCRRAGRLRKEQERSKARSQAQERRAAGGEGHAPPSLPPCRWAGGCGSWGGCLGTRPAGSASPAETPEQHSTAPLQAVVATSSAPRRHGMASEEHHRQHPRPSRPAAGRHPGLAGQPDSWRRQLAPPTCASGSATISSSALSCGRLPSGLASSACAAAATARRAASRRAVRSA